MAEMYFDGPKLREIREAKRVRKELLGALVSKSVATIDRYESNKTEPPTRVAAAMAMALGCDINDFVRAREAMGASA